MRKFAFVLAAIAAVAFWSARSQVHRRMFSIISTISIIPPITTTTPTSDLSDAATWMAPLSGAVFFVI